MQDVLQTSGQKMPGPMGLDTALPEVLSNFTVCRDPKQTIGKLHERHGDSLVRAVQGFQAGLKEPFYGDGYYVMYKDVWWFGNYKRPADYLVLVQKVPSLADDGGDFDYEDAMVLQYEGQRITEIQGKHGVKPKTFDGKTAQELLVERYLKAAKPLYDLGVETVLSVSPEKQEHLSLYLDPDHKYHPDDLSRLAGGDRLRHGLLFFKTGLGRVFSVRKTETTFAVDEWLLYADNGVVKVRRDRDKVGISLKGDGEDMDLCPNIPLSIVYRDNDGVPFYEIQSPTETQMLRVRDKYFDSKPFRTSDDPRQMDYRLKPDRRRMKEIFSMV